MKLGDVVEWESQSGGFSKKKCGVIAEVVAVGKRPSDKLFPQFYRRVWGCGACRDHESYVVLVKKTPYRPVVKNLKPVSKA